ncbi:MAG: AraC family ligand binding domain-containing protein [Blautia sp.]|nr:AraC family ligand binding domain-containing protein [Butyrivibrio sp.]MCM1543063.1 AraC family ligand binding domain-containing protein [Blautia sp.]
METHEVIKGSGRCVNAGSTFPYETGTISIMPAGVPHEVHAGSEGLYLFAKFMPALC